MISADLWAIPAGAMVMPAAGLRRSIQRDPDYICVPFERHSPGAWCARSRSVSRKPNVRRAVSAATLRVGSTRPLDAPVPVYSGHSPEGHNAPGHPCGPMAQQQHRPVLLSVPGRHGLSIRDAAFLCAEACTKRPAVVIWPWLRPPDPPFGWSMPA